jgi:hypothetical protein
MPVGDTGGGLHAYACTWILDLFIFKSELQQRNLWVLNIKKFEFGLKFVSNGEIGCEFKSKPSEWKRDRQHCPNPV